MMVKAMDVTVGNPARKLVLLKLADNANDEGECWPSYGNIAKHCEISRRSAIAHVKSLCDAGLVSKCLRVGEKGNKSNKFFLHFGGEKSAPLETDNTYSRGENSAPSGVKKTALGGEKSAPRTSQLDPVNKRSIVELENSTPDNHVSDDVKSVVEHLNNQTGSRFQPKGQTAKLINARLNDGFSNHELIQVINHKVREWGSDARMCQYLRPTTLFNVNKFPGYLSQAKNIQSGVVVESARDWVPDDDDTSWINSLHDSP
ncbi:conserved phage C-terminal domain-containing protein [Vibrio rhizosphaerae]|uniref:Conserved phage C-terminal domain-containing protein n=1 Tax=Vibrio rhizosphaerae TaxID=398736 RepID=A0ABU4IXF4_9VIBR|nr:conserved phage C-terminal domain-containing protein [Vibrio rhizosphaerae]MDW6094030.1 conserved phage C-terminal domain-containing protein [Vibrio rhizosphaerae]